MKKSKQTAPQKIIDLVDKFERNIQDVKNIKYNETLIRVEFVNPFFKALGWDVDNKAGKTLAYRDVIHEDEVKVSGVTKAPDYSFRSGGVRKFFVETKKPSINLKDDPSPAFQLRRYGYSARLPISILTDFEEFIIYDCNIKPSIKDKSTLGRIKYYTFKEYIHKWDEISALFHRDAVQSGSIDKFVKETKGIRGTTQIDKDFLSDLDSWRLELARNFAIRNPQLTSQQLNYAVQMTIDRMIFLRMCEDRGIESYGQLFALVNGLNTYPRLIEIYHRADEKYNSGLFHFTHHKGDASAADELTPGLVLDDKVLKNIIKQQYYPESPYEFSVLPVEVLGNAYEQFLGKTISLTDTHQAQINEKPEVRKAGGVYYTPQYIVSYIVNQTIGKLVENKNVIEVSRIKILDPACGSGSFLLGAYQYLLDWHLNWYKNEMEQTKKIPTMPVSKGKRKKKSDPAAIFQEQHGDWFLSTAEKKRILLNNIYGVDIDQQAVEVTKLSLLLKVLENENKDTLNRQLTLWRERALPDLANNIKCGNSLIGSDIYNSGQMELWSDEQRMRVNAFDWDKEFPDIMSSGGFDVVIGNPPYGFHQIHSERVKEYFKSHYVSSRGSFEHYFLFYEASLIKVRPNGYHGFIVPVTWLTIPSALSLRRFILDNFSIELISWLPENVFKDAQVNTLVSIIKRSKSNVTRVLISEINDPTFGQGIVSECNQKKFVEAGYIIHIFESQSETDLLKRIESKCVSLQSIARPCSGYNPYEVGKGISPKGGSHTQETIASRPYHSQTVRGKDWKPEIIGRDLGRYILNWPRNRFVHYGLWLAAPRDPQNFFGPRLLVQEITGSKERRIIASFCKEELYYSRDVIPIKCDSNWPKPFFLLGIVNSWFITWRHHRRSPKAKKALFPKVLVRDLAQIPVPTLSQSNPADKVVHDRMVKIVEHMLSLHKRLAVAKTDHEKTALQRQINATDNEIDRLVYQLYGLTEEEIKMVENMDKNKSDE